MGADRPLDRVDAVAKVTGAARYATEQPAPDLAHAVMVTSTIARGRIVAIDGASAEGVPGVLAVLTPENAEKLPRRRREDGDAPVLHLLQDGAIRYANQPIAVVIADTLEAAQEGARLVRVRYDAEPPDVSLPQREGRAYAPDQGADEAPDSRRGDVASALDRSEVRVEQVYTTPFETHNPMEPHATMAAWEGPRALTLHDGTQGIFDCRARVAEVLGLAPEDVRVISPYLGGGFGSKGPVWSHVVLAAMAARAVSRPVKLVLTRPQMFGPVGWRSRTVQRVAIGATRAGVITAIRHDTLAQTSAFDQFVELAGLPARMLYACPHNATSHRLVRSDIGTPSYMRAPGWAPGTYALECAIDELAHALDKDPVDLRLENYAAEDPETGRPWSENSLRECYREGAERFGWSRRPRAPGSMRDGEIRIGWGMATSVYPTHRSAASALARLYADGSVVIETGTQDLGTGTYTVVTQVAAEALGVSPQRVTCRLGDTRLPEAPLSGGSQTAASVGSAVHLAALAVRAELVRLAVSDPRSPLSGVGAEDVRIEAGRLFHRGSPARGETMSALLARRGGAPLEKRVEARPDDEDAPWSTYAFGAQFVEVRVDDLGRVRVSRMVGVFDIGRVVNPKTARSQLVGGMVGGIGMALHEASIFDERLGRVVNGNLADYHVPVQRDVPDIDAAWIGVADERANPIGAKGIGELGITGAAAAIANAVYHATRRRVRDLPITLDKLL